MHGTNLAKDQALNFGDYTNSGSTHGVNKFGDSASAVDFGSWGSAKIPEATLNSLTDFSISFWYKETT